MQAQSKASTLSSGARAAAQTLNVPIERLEAQIHSTTKASSPSSPSHGEKHMQHHSHHEETLISHIEQNGKSNSPNHQYQQQLSHQSSQSGGGIHGNGNHQYNSNGTHHHKALLNNGNKDDQLDTDEQMSSLNTTPTAKYSLLQFAMQHFRNE